MSEFGVRPMNMELSRVRLARWLMNADREDIQRYLENRGFAVYDHEPTEALREAVRLDMETEGVI